MNARRKQNLRNKQKENNINHSLIKNERLLYAFYSEKQANRCGTAIYRRANGEEIEVSEVSENPKSISQCEDIQELGLVLHYSNGGWVRKWKERKLEYNRL